MSVVLIPDIELLVGNTLRNHPDIIALDARAAGALPRSFTKSWVRITQLDAQKEANSDVDHLISYLVQLDAYAGSASDNAQAQASALARTARAALMELQGQMIDSTVISKVETRSHARIPDLDFDPPRERVILTMEIFAHAA